MKKLASLIIMAIAIFFLASNAFDENPAVNFLNSLDDDQKKLAQFSFNDPSRTAWHFLPGAMWPRQGIPLYELNASQKELLFEVLKVHLSNSGYTKTLKIIDLENVLAEISGNSNFRDSEKYYAAFYGNPEKDSLWAWSFEGHHISLNFSVINNNISVVPRFLGASPALIKKGPRTGERVLAKEQDYGFQLLHSLSYDQKQIAIFRKTAYADIVTSNSSEVGSLIPVGIKMKELSNEQQIILMNLLYEYLSTMPKALADKRMTLLKAEETNDIRFGWAGSIEKGKPHYYRVQGKSFLVEFDNLQYDANHIHTVWRDFNGDFGRDLIREHYEKSHHKE